MLIEKVLHLRDKENIAKTKEVLRKPGRLSLLLQILWNCVIHNIPLRGHRGSVKNDAELAESALILWHRVEGGDRNLENHVQSGSSMPHVLLFQFRFFFSFFRFLNCNVN